MQINGASAFTAVPHSSALNLSGAAQLALTRSLIAKAAPDGPRVASFVIMQFVSTRANPLGGDALMADEVGAAVARFVTDPPGHAILASPRADRRQPPRKRSEAPGTRTRAGTGFRSHVRQALAF